MKCWIIFDTHNHHRKLRVPQQIDVVMHCGDESESGNPWLNEPEVRAFFEWYAALLTLPIAGNGMGLISETGN